MNNVTITIDKAQIGMWINTRPEAMAHAIERIIYKASLMVERGAKVRSPVDTGRLRSSISSDIRPMQATVSTHVNYAGYVHDGTKYMKARPFMRDAANETSQQIQGIVDEEVDNALK